MNTWHGRRGAVILGPTEDRVARYLDSATRHGRVTIRTVDLATRLQLERSEAYRITRRLRTLGLFGIENDRGGTKGGRRYWRTAREHDGNVLDDRRHRVAWSRIVAYLRTRRERLHRGLAALRQRQHVVETRSHGLPTPAPASGEPLPAGAGGTFRERLRAAAVAQGLTGVVAMVDDWGAA